MQELRGAGPLAGRHALVTGAGRGIGAAVARALAHHGAAVTWLGRDRAALEAVAAPFAGQGRVAIADVTDRAALGRSIAAAAEAFGPIGILVNNAGTAESAPFARTEPALLDRMLAVNLVGAFHATQAVLPTMLERRWGRIVNVASTAGLKGYAYVTAYCAAKHALVGLTRALAVETAAQGITVNAVCPGYTETDLLAGAVAGIAARTGRSEAEARAVLARTSPLGRFVRPEEVANAVAWLVLPGSEAVTGQAIVVAGGEAT